MFYDNYLLDQDCYLWITQNDLPVRFLKRIIIKFDESA